MSKQCFGFIRSKGRVFLDLGRPRTENGTLVGSIEVPLYQEGDFGLRPLATVCYYLLIGTADLEFPSSSAPHPSKEVWVVRTPRTLARPGDQGLFPLIVDWKSWHFAVVPVLEGEEVNPLLPVNASRPIDDYIRLLETRLIESFQAQGFLPETV
jgi:hypothetical protein